MRNYALALVTLLPSIAVAQEPAKKPAPAPIVKPTPPKAPAEVAETVSMFKGNWSFDVTLTATGMPGMEKPVKAKMLMPCKAIAGSTAVACDAKLKTAMGPWDGHFVFAWDPHSKAVHFIGVTSNHEVHDHVCGQWDHGMAGKSGLTCAPYKGGMGAAGEEVTEDVMFAFRKDGKELTFTSTTKMKSGATLTFEGTGKR